MKAVIYVRVSTVEQAAENQLPMLEKMCQQRDWEVYQVYQEQGSAWHSGHQPKLQHLLQDARQGKFQVVLVWSLDRLSRAGATAILQLVDRLRRYGVKVVSYNESWTEAPGELAEILYAIAGWVAQMESKRQSERVKAGLARAKAQGKIGKRGPDKKRRRRRWWKRPL